MAKGANLRLSGAVLGQLANPNFARAAGMSVGAGMLGAQRREEEADYRATEEVTLELLRKAQAAQEQGDMDLHNEIVDTFDGMLTGNKYQKTRQLLTDALTTVGGQRAATQKTSQTNTAMSILKTEDALQNMKDERSSLEVRDSSGQVQLSGIYTSGQDKAMGALEDRLAQMKQDPKAVAEADEIDFQRRLQDAKNSNALAEQQAQIAKRTLGSVQFGSENYNSIKADLKKQGFGQAIDQYETTQYALIEAADKADNIRRSRAPLTKDEIQTLENNNFTPTGDIRRDRDRLALISETIDKRIIMQANADTARVASEGILPIVETVLDRYAKRGDIPLNIRDDLYNKIEDMSAEDKLRLADSLKRPSGEELTTAQIEQEVISFLKTEFSDQFERMETRQDNLRIEQEEIEILTADLMAQAAEKDPALQGIITRGKDGTVKGIENVDEAVYRKYRMEAESRRGPITSFVRSVTNTNRSSEAEERREATQQNMIRNMGRGL